ncbi:aminotransferase class V-fold PLP-dependent enzyme [Gordonia sp. OPL2]|uniref:aminotransferase class V-fold PLP-dependent enzyme n=1 Tax=Gordonia sp. OPL2 TaxID=2486274 RepID=UPI001655E01D|nr:aminotransferase class V-fold PLP-dependent enzyme [Gordonia sp. OPL2]RPA06205.1 aminotransferase class V-fold PLP-dependent enzyme [Gordonia sp. OPL2]
MTTVQEATTSATEQLAAFRGRFPHLDDVTHLASCSQGALSVDLQRRLQDMQDDLIADPAPWGRWMELVENLRARFAARIGAAPEQVAIAPNASIAAYQVRSTIHARGNKALLTSDHEFPSVGHVWRASADGTPIRSIAADDVLTASAGTAQIDDTVGLVSAPLVSYINGTRPPVRAIADAAHAAGAAMFVDAYQGSGVVPFTVDELGCDFLVTGTLKYMLGLPGLAFLYVRHPEELDNPALTGWFGRSNPFNFDPANIEAPSTAAKFETGTPGVPSVYAALGGLDALDTVDADAGWAHVQRLAERTATELRALGEQIDRPEDPTFAGPQVALVDDDPDTLAAWLLAEHRISTAPRGKRLRISFHYYNTDNDVDRIITALAAYRRP